MYPEPVCVFRVVTGIKTQFGVKIVCGFPERGGIIRLAVAEGDRCAMGCGNDGIKLHGFHNGFLEVFIILVPAGNIGKDQVCLCAVILVQFLQISCLTGSIFRLLEVLDPGVIFRQTGIGIDFLGIFDLFIVDDLHGGGDQFHVGDIGIVTLDRGPAGHPAIGDDLLPDGVADRRVGGVIRLFQLVFHHLDSLSVRDVLFVLNRPDQFVQFRQTLTGFQCVLAGGFGSFLPFLSGFLGGGQGLRRLGRSLDFRFLLRCLCRFCGHGICGAGGNAEGGSQKGICKNGVFHVVHLLICCVS